MKFEIIPVTHYEQNCSLIWCENTQKAALVDPGGDIPKILKVIERLGVQVEQILLTHGHMDHVGASPELSRRLSVPIIGPHKEDMFWLERLPLEAPRMGFTPIDVFTPDEWLEEGQVVQVGEQTLETFHCPGHTPGHIIFYHRPTKMAFVGDVIFAGSIGRSDFPRGDYDALTNAIRSKLWPLGDDVKFVPGHGPMSTFGQERKTNRFVADARFG